MNQEAPSQSIELSDMTENCAPPSGSTSQQPHDSNSDSTQTETNNVVASNQAATTVPVIKKETIIHRMFKHCSSQRVGVFFGLVALVIAIYSYYGQYQLSWKSWELGLWKDCRDRDAISDSSVCQRLQNMTYDQIAARNLESPSTSALAISNRSFSISNSIRELLDSKTSRVVYAIAPIVDCIALISWFGATGSLTLHVLVFISDMTLGHTFPYKACLAVYMIINTSIATLVCSSWIVKTVSGSLSILNLLYHFKSGKAALDVCVEARPNPVTKDKWERYSVSGLICTPHLHMFNPGLLLYTGHAVTLSLLPKAFAPAIGDLYTASTISLFAFTVLLSITQNFILHTRNHLSMDCEAQSAAVILTAHKDMLLSQMEAVFGQVRNLGGSSRAGGRIA